jgi:hypothetical protein
MTFFHCFAISKEVVTLERYFVLPRTIDRVRSSWIAETIERYVAWVANDRPPRWP